MLIEEATTFIFIDKVIHNTINIILIKGTKAGQKQSINRWLITVSQDAVARYDCLAGFCISRACENDASNPKKKRKRNQDLKGVKSLR